MEMFPFFAGGLLGFFAAVVLFASGCVRFEDEEELKRRKALQQENDRLKAEVASLTASKVVRIDPRPDGEPPRVVPAPKPAVPVARPRPAPVSPPPPPAVAPTAAASEPPADPSDPPLPKGMRTKGATP